MEAEILMEIKNSENKADEIIERDNREKGEILEKAKINSSKLLDQKKEEISKAKEKKIIDFRDKTESVKKEKIRENKKRIYEN